MERSDGQLILDLAARLRDAQPTQRDRQATDLIQNQIACQPDAVYLLVRSVLLHEEALREARSELNNRHNGLNRTRIAPEVPANEVTRDSSHFLPGLLGNKRGMTVVPDLS